jgi:hypothetical protein
MRSSPLNLVLLTILAVGGGACSDEFSGTLFINFAILPPDTTSLAQVAASGEIVRVPPRASTLKWLTITGGAETVVDTAGSFGTFDVTIPLNLDATNRLEFVARDDSGARSELIIREVLHRATL